ncbi:redox-sensing transcriptional repressor Rex [Tichowtungia aerotolerans]|uniref:Redox-sensing transcriptional repressor Rex n=1 Tax=Tichowtungia aerotolerans TaxID=2697043 RepID=A0A6P1M833_9BACT|nr:redox-sensing transcriptional repressor Rex [Tichowtungia aerotolerans]QHI68684.1 redox-sensing transcriptional repressor Rex [Tichowtungia aerotolerans]
MSQIERKTAGVPTLKRLPLYLRLLRQMQAAGDEYASGAVVAKELGLDPIVVRKDLAITGAVGRPRLGFQMDEIITAIEDFLGWSNTTDAFLAGIGNLGTALLGYQGFEQHGMRIVAVFDANPDLIGQTIHGKTILDIKKLPTLAKRMHVQIGIITATASVAQGIADSMIEGGIRGIWNFTPTKLSVPDHVTLQREDLASSLAVLSHRLLIGHRSIKS